MPIFMKYDGVDGRVDAAAGHGEWIEPDRLSFGGAATSAQGSGGGVFIPAGDPDGGTRLKTFVCPSDPHAVMADGGVHRATQTTDLDLF